MANMNDERMYVAFYGDKKIELPATSLFRAKEGAVKQLKVPKSKRHMVTVLLVTEYEKGNFDCRL